MSRSIEYRGNYADHLNFSHNSLTGVNSSAKVDNSVYSGSDEEAHKTKNGKSHLNNKKGLKSKKEKDVVEEQSDQLACMEERIAELTEEVRSSREEHKKALDHMKNKLIEQFKKMIERMEQIAAMSGAKALEKTARKDEPGELKKIEGVDINETRRIRKVDKGQVAARSFSRNMNQELFFHKNPSDNIPFEPGLLCPVNPDSRYFKRFIITKNEFELDVNDYTILVAKPLQLKQQSMMTILKTRNSNIWLGLVDEEHIKSRAVVQLNRCILYAAQDGSISEDGKNVMKSGSGYRIGERVGVTFSTEQGQAVWTINCRFKCQYTSQKIKDNTIRWVPAIAMRDRGDIVKWEQHSIEKK